VKPAVFLDRDGTLIEERGYLDRLDLIQPFPWASAALRRLREAGYALVLVTNQAGVARGYFDEAFVQEAHRHLAALLEADGVVLDGYYYCPHHPEAGSGPYRRECDCRKPGTGMLLRARDEMGIDLEASYMVGDSHKDIEAGHGVGAKTVLVLTGYGRGELEHQPHRFRKEPDHVAADLLEAVEWILETSS